jgi:tetratricopeptide (TPR) repeat protein
MARRDDDYRSHEVPWLRRVLDDTYGLLAGAVVGAIRGVFHFLFLLVTAPLRWTGFIRSSLDDQESKDRTANALMGIPAVVAGIGLIWLVFVVTTAPGYTIGGRYRIEAKKAQENGDFKTALLLYTRLRTVESGNLETTYDLAMLYDKTGRRDLARSLMMQIAPLDRLGHPMAHVWLATQLINPRSTPQEIEIARTHLLRLLQLSPTHPQANALMAQLDVRSGRFAEAEQRLRTAVEGNPGARLILAKLFARFLNRPKDAKVEAEEVRAYFEAELRRNPEDHQARETLAECFMLMGDHARAVTIMKEGEALFPKSHYQEKLALVYGDWANTLPRSDARRWPLFIDAFKHGAAVPQVVGALLKVALDDKQDEMALRAALDSFRKNKDAQAGSAELLLGLLSVHRGKPGEAAAHFKRAGELEPLSPSLGAMSVDAARLEEITVLDLAIALKTAWPDRADLRRFHGIALAAAGKRAESLVELELLVNEGRRDASLFDTLADVTAKLGLQEKSEQYKKRAMELSPYAEQAKEAGKADTAQTKP